MSVPPVASTRSDFKFHQSGHSKGTIAYILKGYPRISETFISNEILLLERLGFSLRLFSMRLPRETFCHDSVKEIKARVDYLPTDLLQQLRTLLIPSLFLACKRPASFAAACRLAAGGLLPGKILATGKHLLQACYLVNKHLLHDPSTVHLHGHFAHSPTSVTHFSSVLSGLPFSFTAHAKDIYTSAPDKLRRKIAAASFVATCTGYNREYLRDLAQGIDTPIYCLYHGIDLGLFQANQQGIPGTISDIPRFLTVARMTAKKGLPTLYHALAKLKSKGLLFRHTLIGDGDDRQLILDLISRLQLGDCCHCLGTQPHHEVLSQFRQSDLFLLPCEIAENGDRDGIPNVLVESLAMGVPAISTTVSAIPELLINGETGITVPPANPEILAEAIDRLLKDPDLRQQLAEKGKRHVQAHFDNTSLVRDLGQVFSRHNLVIKAPLPPVASTP